MRTQSIKSKSPCDGLSVSNQLSVSPCDGLSVGNELIVLVRYVLLLCVVIVIVLYYYLVSSCIILYFIVDKRGYQSIGVAAWQDADEDGIPDLQDGDLNNDGIMDRTVKNDAYLNCK